MLLKLFIWWFSKASAVYHRFPTHICVNLIAMGSICSSFLIRAEQNQNTSHDLLMLQQHSGINKTSSDISYWQNQQNHLKLLTSHWNPIFKWNKVKWGRQKRDTLNTLNFLTLRPTFSRLNNIQVAQKHCWTAILNSGGRKKMCRYLIKRVCNTSKGKILMCYSLLGWKHCGIHPDAS